MKYENKRDGEEKKSTDDGLEYYLFTSSLWIESKPFRIKKKKNKKNDGKKDDIPRFGRIVRVFFSNLRYILAKYLVSVH